MKDIRSEGEFGFISRLREMFPSYGGVRGIGDDCAVLPRGDGKLTLVSTDMLIEGTHFLLSDADARMLGWKSLAVNLSDIAAMGGTPVSSFLSIAVPTCLPEGWLEDFIEGYREVAGKFGIQLSGGDTTSSKAQLCICITVVGECNEGEALLRSGARPGDLVCVTGPLGGSSAGLRRILSADSPSDKSDPLVRRHYLPEPRIAEGKALAACGAVHSMMDLSDGIASDIRHIMEESGVGAEIDVSLIPLESGDVTLEDALEGGEDYELLFTIASDAEKTLEIRHFVLGRIVPGNELRWIGAERDFMGFRHF